MIITPIESKKKKMKKLKDGVVTIALSPHNSPITSMSVVILLPSHPQVQVVDLGDGGSSESESAKFAEATKKTTKEEKCPESSKLTSQVLKNPFSSTTKTLTPIKRKMFSIDTLGTTSMMIGT